MSEATPPRHLILIKHARPTIDPAAGASRWSLSAAGRTACDHLAQRLAAYRLTAIAASDEPKAHETATLLAAALGFSGPFATDHNLREHERRASDFFPDPAQFESAVRDLFARPDELVFGAETASAARDRFSVAVARHLTATPTGDLAIVAHGTVISLFVAAHNRLDPFALWQTLGLPSFVVLTLPDRRLIETVGQIAD